MVLTHKGRFRPVLSTSSRIADNLIRIEPKTLDGITMTKRHPLFAMDVEAARDILSIGWVPAGEIEARIYRSVIREGKEFLEARPNRAHAATLPVVTPEQPIDEIDLRQWAALPQGKKYDFLTNDEVMTTSHGRIQAIRWRQKLDFSFGRFIGLYLAEGSMRRAQIEWSFHIKERTFIQEVKDFIRDRIGCNASERTQGNCTVVLGALPLLESFFAECGRGAENKVIPEWVWDAPDEFVRGLVEGYIDGDGSIVRGFVCAVTVSLSLAWGIRLLCLRLGLHASIRVQKTAGTAMIGERLFNTKTIYSVSWREIRQGGGAAIVHGNVAGYSIMQKTTIEGAAEVFNMEVADDNSYCTTGGIVHNCKVFPRGDHDDYYDTVTQAILYLRKTGLIIRDEEKQEVEEIDRKYRPNLNPLYPA
jgi:intein/homing endonuclease